MGARSQHSLINTTGDWLAESIQCEEIKCGACQSPTSSRIVGKLN